MKSVPQHILWPAIIVALLLTNIGIAVGTLIISKSDGGARVVPEYYSAAVAWDSLAASNQNFSDLQWAVELNPSRAASRLSVSVTDHEQKPLSGLNINVALSQPHRTHSLGTYDLIMIQPGRYEATEILFPAGGLYDFDIVISIDSLRTGVRRRVDVP